MRDRLRLKDELPVTVILLAISLLMPTQPVNSQDYDIVQHGQECRAEIGPIPSFSCLDGEVIPITNNGQPVNTEQDLGPNRTCDRPPWLDLGGPDQCVPFSRLGRLPGVNAAGQTDENIQWVFICRRYQFRPMDRTEFDDVAVIGHNKTTGGTCFFQALGDLDGSNVPSPTSDDGSVQDSARLFWLKPAQTARILGGRAGCDFCHDSDPFIHTPYVDQVKLKDTNGDVIVDQNDNQLTVVHRVRELDQPYKHIGKPFQPHADGGLWSKPTHIQPAESTCGDCHRIGLKNSCATFARWATGTAMPGVNDTFKIYPKAHWMPFAASHTDQPSSDMLFRQDTWEERYRDSVDLLLQCCDNPEAPECGGRKPTPPN